MLAIPATLHDVPAKAGGVKAAVGAGTGLGEVFLIDSAPAAAAAPVYVAYPCEGGMTEFLAHDEEECEYPMLAFNVRAVTVV